MRLLGISILVMSLIGAALAVSLRRQHKLSLSPDAFQASEQSAYKKREPLNLPLANPRIIITKSKRRLELYSGEELVRAYRIGLGLDPVNDKIREGDRRTPEGTFFIYTKNSRSKYYLSLGLSYPDEEDARRGLRDGLITRRQYEQIARAGRRKEKPPQKTALGGEIYIHGNGSQSDWTWGCIALENDEMKELYEAVAVRTQVIIQP